MTLTAISIDRLLALMLGLQYRQVVTLRSGMGLGGYRLALQRQVYYHGALQSSYILQHLCYRGDPVYNSLELLLHEDLSRTWPKPGSGTTPCSSSTTEPRTKCTEYGQIQKDCVHCVVGPDNTGGLLSSICHSGSCGIFLWPSSQPRMASPTNSYYVELDPKPNSLLLEDKENEKSSEGHDQTIVLFLLLIVVASATISVRIYSI